MRLPKKIDPRVVSSAGFAPCLYAFGRLSAFAIAYAEMGERRSARLLGRDARRDFKIMEQLQP